MLAIDTAIVVSTVPGHSSESGSRAFPESLQVMSNHLFLLMPTREEGCWILLRLTNTGSPVSYSISKLCGQHVTILSWKESLLWQGPWGHSTWKAGVISLPRGT